MQEMIVLNEKTLKDADEELNRYISSFGAF